MNWIAKFNVWRDYADIGGCCWSAHTNGKWRGRGGRVRGRVGSGAVHLDLTNDLTIASYPLKEERGKERI